MSSNFQENDAKLDSTVTKQDAGAPAVVPQQLYTFNVSKFLNKEYIPFLEDAIRMVVIQFVIQFMFFLKSPSLGVLFSFRFIELLVYIVLGVATYWLVFKKLVFLS